MTQIASDLKPSRGKPKLKPGVDTVLIGFKGTIDSKETLEKIAAKLGISYSELLRTIMEDFIMKSKGILL